MNLINISDQRLFNNLKQKSFQLSVKPESYISSGTIHIIKDLLAT